MPAIPDDVLSSPSRLDELRRDYRIYATCYGIPIKDGRRPKESSRKFGPLITIEVGGVVRLSRMIALNKSMGRASSGGPVLDD